MISITCADVFSLVHFSFPRERYTRSSSSSPLKGRSFIVLITNLVTSVSWLGQWNAYNDPKRTFCFTVVDYDMLPLGINESPDPGDAHKGLLNNNSFLTKCTKFLGGTCSEDGWWSIPRSLALQLRLTCSTGTLMGCARGDELGLP